MTFRSLLTAALVFADATIVTLALPNLLVDLNTSVYGVAAVLAVYTAVLGCTALVRTAASARGASYAWIGVGALCLFSLACVGCALAGGIAVLLAARAVQGFAGALVLTVAGAALAPPRRAGRAWVSIGVLSAAAWPGRGRCADPGVLVARDLRRPGAGSTRCGRVLWKTWSSAPPLAAPAAAAESAPDPRARPRLRAR